MITDFSHGDVIEIKGVFADFDALQSAMTQAGSATVIALDANHSITLTGVAMTSLSASDFHLDAADAATVAMRAPQASAANGPTSGRFVHAAASFGAMHAPLAPLATHVADRSLTMHLAGRS